MVGRTGSTPRVPLPRGQHTKRSALPIGERSPLLGQEAEEHQILEDAPDEELLSLRAFPPEAQLLDEPAGTEVARQAVGADLLELEDRESIIDEAAAGFRPIALGPKGPPQPEADFRAAVVGLQEKDPGAHEPVVLLLEDGGAHGLPVSGHGDVLVHPGGSFFGIFRIGERAGDPGDLRISGEGADAFLVALFQRS